MKPTACPYPFPILWHRTMEQVIADEMTEARREWRKARREKRRGKSGLPPSATIGNVGGRGER